MLPALLLLILFSVPLTAILSNTYLKVKRLQLERGGDPQLAARVARLEAENQLLRERVEVLETIVTMGDVKGSRVRVDGRVDEAEGEPARREAPVGRRGATG